jgi:glycosyltransferase involved in cell wall biosynthesis
MTDLFNGSNPIKDAVTEAKKQFKKVGLLITTYNRPEYLKECFKSLKKAELTHIDFIEIVDDCSSNEGTLELIKSFEIENKIVSKFTNERNSKISYSIKQGTNRLFHYGCDIVINLDGDAIVRNDFVSVLLELYYKFPTQLITGFNCNTLNKDGSVRHHIIEQHSNYNTKKTVGGVNLLYDRTTYNNYILPALNQAIEKGGNWDYLACMNQFNDGKSVIVAHPSVIQHIGINSSMGHTSVEKPDTSDDFKKLHLPNITLIGIDNKNIDKLKKAAEISCKDIQFGAVKLLTDIDWIKSKEQYSDFIIKELHNYIGTDYALIIQHDGYVVNEEAWSNEFLNYDYIGATWWFNDGMNVGNGGFSLRSKRLIELCAKIGFTKNHPEDEVICRKHRKLLESQGIKFAPEHIAKQFSIEGFRQKEKHYTNQFGFHGVNILKQLTQSESQTIIVNQFQGLGDVIFAMELINTWIRQGNKVIWGVVPEYVSIQKHFPNVTFVPIELLNININNKFEERYGTVKVVPLRWADQIIGVHYRNVMRAKYDMYNEDWNNWRNIEIVRDLTKEKELFYNVLKLKDNEQYNLINTKFRTNQSGISNEIRVDNELPNIEMRNIDGFTMIDWLMVIQKATYIHSVSTSIIYLLELFELQAKEVHLYVRKPDERNFDFIDYILTKNYVKHL